MKTLNQPDISHDQIARAAYLLWEQRGCPSGCDVQLWLEAERQLLHVLSADNGSTALMTMPHEQSTPLRPASAAGGVSGSRRTQPAPGRASAPVKERSNRPSAARP